MDSGMESSSKVAVRATMWPKSGLIGASCERSKLCAEMDAPLRCQEESEMTRGMKRSYAVHVDVALAIYPWIASALLIVAVTSFGFLIRNPRRRVDLQVTIYLSRRTGQVMGALFLVLSAGVAILLGIGFITSGRFYGWGLFPLACLPLTFLGFYIYVGRLPFHYPEEIAAQQSK